MKVLIVGSGGREHALAWSLAASPLLGKLYCAPGNPGIEAVAECVAIPATDTDALVALAKEKDIGFVVIGQLLRSGGIKLGLLVVAGVLIGLQLVAALLTPEDHRRELFVERLVAFWSNHFTVSSAKPIVAGLTGAFEREAIRPHLGGSFGELLRATASHPAMLIYLDNARSIGPDSPAEALMRSRTVLRIALLGVLGAALPAAAADNPVVQTCFTADPAPLVHDGVVYLYTSHDEDNASGFTMYNWLLYTTTDMVNWTDHGAVLSYKVFEWSRGDAWAGQCIPRNGKFYYYLPVNMKNGGNAIGVAVSTSPTGPFSDALGRPLVQNAEIDPTVFVDTDGQAYLYYGNPNLWYVKLNEDMISYDQTVGIVQVPLTTESFGVRYNNPDRKTAYEEGPWFYKRNSIYYMLYAAGGVPENISYSEEPWNRKPSRLSAANARIASPNKRPLWI